MADEQKPLRLPRRHVAESVTNRILNAQDEIREVTVRYRTREDAARQGLIRALDRAGTGDTEFGGIIFKDANTGEFYLGTNGGKAMELAEGTKDNINIRGTPITKGDTVAGSFHTHPPKDRKGSFSGEDVHSARASEVPSYIGLAHDRSARVFDPSVESSRTRRGPSVRDSGSSPGKPFGETMTRIAPGLLDQLLSELQTNGEDSGEN